MNSMRRNLLKSCLLILVLSLFSKVTHAEGNCPEGYYPIGGESGQSGPQGCAPIPRYNLRSVRWADQWGAMATDDAKGIVRSIINAPNRGEAEREALAGCRAEGGMQCKVELSYFNQCVAMTVGDEKHSVSSAATIEKAVQASLLTCSAATKNCHVYRTDCSLPKRIQ